MVKYNFFRLFSLLTCSLALFSCESNYSEKFTDSITHLPFKAEKGERWGLIDWDGNVLIDDEFKHVPTFVSEGMFFVENENGLYELYTAEKKFRKVGNDYVSIGLFSDGLAPVVEPGKPIKYIKTNGETAFDLAEYKGENIKYASMFYEGKALFITENGMRGYVNTKGKVIIPPVYNDASFFCNGYAYVSKDGNTFLIDEKQKVWMNAEEEDLAYLLPSEGLITFTDAFRSDYGLKTVDGKVVMKPSSKITGILGFYNGYSVYRNTDNDCGLINNKGEILIRAKYDEMYLCKDVIVYKDRSKYGIMDYSGNVILEPKYDEIFPFFGSNKHTFATDGKDMILIDKKGEEASKETYADVEFPPVEFLPFMRPSINARDVYSLGIVASDYIDLESEAEKATAYVKDTGLDKVPYGVLPEVFADAYGKDYKVSDLRGVSELTTELSYSDYMDIKISCGYADNVIVPEYDSYYHSIVTGYRYNNISPASMNIVLELKGRMASQKNEFGKALVEAMKGRGFRYLNGGMKDGGYVAMEKSNPYIKANVIMDSYEDKISISIINDNWQ